jgi:hypothetical protein
MIAEDRNLLNAICRIFRDLEEAGGPTDPAVIQAKRALLNGLAELRLIDALDDAGILATLIALPRK